MLINIQPICGISVGFELESDDGDKYLFIYLVLISIGILYHEQ